MGYQLPSFLFLCGPDSSGCKEGEIRPGSSCIVLTDDHGLLNFVVIILCKASKPHLCTHGCLCVCVLVYTYAYVHMHAHEHACMRTDEIQVLKLNLYFRGKLI